MVCNETDPLVNPVIQSHPLLRQSHVSFFRIAHQGIYSENVFPA